MGTKVCVMSISICAASRSTEVRVTRLGTEVCVTSLSTVLCVTSRIYWSMC